MFLESCCNLVDAGKVAWLASLVPVDVVNQLSPIFWRRLGWARASSWSSRPGKELSRIIRVRRRCWGLCKDDGWLLGWC